ncbi:long-chain fatty acid--CoA ligase [Dyadobacter subterraneus]|uniref:Long-chain fatty acid--CoA ligase n=1 Tax=Dyadobacter subterraneus TaxID=2773304 RepID=A0ABR9W739_9BACT|nr:long-chain fatty acid--CoA ligase [Dyadobacter subterraneus]MBE9461279.1 long-chain fatty acid--CoA ligase [Dyadobacter subterraneus]
MIQTRLIPRTSSAYDSPLLIKTLLAQTLKYNPQREIIYRNIFRMNYFEFNRRVRRLANLLSNLGIQPGDMVGVMDWDSHRYLECFFAVPAYGAILHTINVRLSPAQILYTINHAEDKIILVHEDFIPILEAIKDKINTNAKFIIISDIVYQDKNAEIIKTGFPNEGEYEKLLSRESELYDFPDFDENTWATTFYTTGTTGEPKGVYFSHRQLFMHTMGLISYFCGYRALPFSDQDVYMPLTPLFHVHAWGFPFVATMLNNKQVYPGRYEPDMLATLLSEQKVTLSHCVPTILNMVINCEVAKVTDLSKWKVLIGGSALTTGLAKAAKAMGITVSAGYGMSETAPVLSVAHLSDEQQNLSEEDKLHYRIKAGRITPFVELRIMDDEGNFLPHDGKSVGEIVGRGPWMTQGYFKDPENSEKLWGNGWLHTGDVGSIDEEYYLTISDRVKDVIKTGGEWVSSLDIENLLSQLEGVSEVAVVGLPDVRWGERPQALIVPKPGFENILTPEIIKNKIQKDVESGKIKKWYVPDQIIFVTEIPKTSVGKIDKKKIRKELSEKF